ncbi:MAG: MFS transporter [Pseudomonadota bacterium]
MTDGRSVPDMLKSLGDPRYASMLVLGFASGLPLMMVFQKLSFWLRDVGIDRATIGFMYWITIAYTLKFLWSPVVDRVVIPVLGPRLGQRRSWMVAAIAGTAIGLLVIGFSNPGQALGVTLLGAFILAYSGATLDIAIDAWRIESAGPDDQGYMAAIYQLGYRFAIMFAGFGLGLAEFFPWYVTFSVMAATMTIGGFLVLAMKEPERAARAVGPRTSFVKSVANAIIEPFGQLKDRLGVWIIAVAGVVALYRLPDFTMGVMASPLYSDLGYSKAAVGAIQGGIGPWILIVGAFAGGFAVARWGVVKALLIGAPLTFLTTAAYAGLANLGAPDAADAIREANGGQLVGVEPPPTIWLFVAIGADNLAGGFVGTAFIAYLSSLTDPRNAATQYACLSSLYAFFCKFAAGFSGAIADAIGYAGLFLLSASYAIPAMIFVWIVLAFGTAAAKGQVSFAKA